MHFTLHTFIYKLSVQIKPICYMFSNLGAARIRIRSLISAVNFLVSSLNVLSLYYSLKNCSLLDSLECVRLDSLHVQIQSGSLQDGPCHGHGDKVCGLSEVDGCTWLYDICPGCRFIAGSYFAVIRQVRKT